MSNSLYTFSSATLSGLSKFRFGSSRVPTMQAVIYKKTYEIRSESDPIDNFEELIDELPDNSPRYIVLSYPLKLKDGRLSTPLVLLYYRPPTCTQDSKMLYAAAVELIREKAGVSKLIQIDDEEDFETIADQLQ